jgi:hypothetical protein
VLVGCGTATMPATLGTVDYFPGNDV